MNLFVFELSAQISGNNRITHEILMSYKWIPSDMYDVDDKETCFLTYTQSQEIDSTTTEEGELKVYVAAYYLSDTPDPVFDKAKVGKVATGKYLIMNRSSDPKIISTFIYELVELSEKKMVMKHLALNMSVYGRTNTFLGVPK